MEASTTTGRARVRLVVVDFLATLFITFCIGVVTAMILGACVMLMAGDANGAENQKPKAAPAEAAKTRTADLVLAHYFAAKYSGLVAVDRLSASASR